MADPTTVLEVEDVSKSYPIRRGLLRRSVGEVKAVDGVSFRLAAGETLGLVGESGCGKSTLARTIVRLVEPTSGVARFRGEDIFTMSGERLRRARRELQIIFQDPYASLNPRMIVGDIVGEAFEIHRDLGIGRRHRAARVRELLDRVGLPSGAMSRYPHEFSGGQRQRIGIARALALEPSVVICDEPVSALDVSVQAQVLNLLKDIQEDLGLSYVFIAHDLSVVRHISDRIAVMYLGRIVESGDAADVYDHARHPYTQALINAAPVTDPKERDRPRLLITGDLPSPSDPPKGCRFSPRCWKADDLCIAQYPSLDERGSTRHHLVACHFALPLVETSETPKSEGD